MELVRGRREHEEVHPHREVALLSLWSGKCRQTRRTKLGLLEALWKGTPFSGTSDAYSYAVKKPTDINYKQHSGTIVF